MLTINNSLKYLDMGTELCIDNTISIYLFSIDSNRLGVDGATALAEALGNNQSVTQLFIGT